MRKPILIPALLLALPFAAGAHEKAAPKKPVSKKAPCPIPASPMNWIMKYCAIHDETGDEIAIQDGACFKGAEADLKNKDECAVNLKYKTKTCELMIKRKDIENASIADCVKDPKVGPFFAGGD